MGLGWVSPLCQLQRWLQRSQHLRSTVWALVCWGSGARQQLARVGGFFPPGERTKSHPPHAVQWLIGTRGCLLPMLCCRAGMLFHCCFSGESCQNGPHGLFLVPGLPMPRGPWGGIGMWVGMQRVSVGTACGHHPGTAPSAFTTSFSPVFPRDPSLPPSSPMGTHLEVRGPLQPDALGTQLTILATFNLSRPSGCLPGAARKPNSPHGSGEPSVLSIFAAGSCR